MTKEERQQVKNEILSAITDIRSRMPKLIEESAPVPPDNAVGRLSRMDAIREKGVRDATLASARNRLAMLEIRLADIDQPDFDLCRRCRRPIPMERLLYIPETENCVNCA